MCMHSFQYHYGPFCCLFGLFCVYSYPYIVLIIAYYNSIFSVNFSYLLEGFPSQNQKYPPENHPKYTQNRKNTSNSPLPDMWPLPRPRSQSHWHNIMLTCHNIIDECLPLMTTQSQRECLKWFWNHSKAHYSAVLAFWIFSHYYY